MATTSLTFVLFSLILCVTPNYGDSVNENLNEQYRPKIWAMLNYLNSNPHRAYNHNYGTLVSAHNKGDFETDLVIDVEVTCHDSEAQCITNNLRCLGTVRYNAETDREETLPGATCHPRIMVDLKDNDQPEAIENVQSSFAGQYEAAVPVSEPPFIRQQAPCVGCLTDIGTNIPGVDALTKTALKHIESERENKMTVIRVIKLQRQIVAGVKFVALVEVATTTCNKAVVESECPLDENCATEYCRVEFMQQPWISRKKNIISNNCTALQEFEASEDRFDSDLGTRNDMDNDINVNNPYRQPEEFNNVDNDKVPNYDKIADNGQADDMLKISGSIMNPIRMKEQEPQVIYKPTEPTSTEPSRLTDEQKLAIDDFLGMMGDDPRPTRATNDDSSSSSSSEEDNDKDNRRTQTSDRSQNRVVVAQTNDNDSSSSSSSEEDNKRPRRDTSNESGEDNDIPLRKKRALTSQLEKISPKEKDLVKSLADLSMSNMDVIDEDNHKRVVLQVLGAKKMEGDAETVYHLTLRVGVSRCRENSSKSDDYCKKRLIDYLTKICKVQVEGGTKKILKSQCENIKRDERDRNRTKRNGIPGGVTQLNTEDAETRQFAADLIDELNASDGGEPNVQLIRVESASSQVVAGSLHKLQMVISINGEERSCLYTVWNRAWIKNGKEIKIKCGSEPEKKYVL